MKLQAPSLLPAPLPKALHKARTTDLPLVAQGRKSVSGSKGPAHNYDYNDDSKRELRDPGDDRGLRRLQWQELLLQWFVSVCVWQPSLQSGGGRETDYYGHKHRRVGTRRRVPLRHNDRIDCYGYYHAGSTTGEVIWEETNDIVWLHHQTDWQTTQNGSKNFGLFFTW